MTEYKYFRCKTCGLLLTKKMIEQGACIGHKVGIAVRGSFWEWFLVKLRIYEPLMKRFANSE